MRKKRVKAGLGSKTVLQKVELGRRLVTSCTGNANFTTPNPLLTDITDASDAAELAFNNAQNGGDSERAILEEKELKLDIILSAFASYVDSIAKGSETVILSSGFRASKDPEPGGEPAQIVDLRAEMTKKKGEIKTRFKRVSKAAAYLLEISDTPEDAGFKLKAIVTATRYMVTGLESLRSYWFRVRAVGRGGLLGPYSDPAEGIAL
jgi:hypothetical protein